jgi:phage pi2 protein 07
MDRFRELNDLKLENVTFYDEFDRPIKIDKKIIENWKFTGLNLTDFIDSDFYKTGFKGQKE